MKKYLVIYYSKTGNSKFLAEKISNELGCDLKKIKPVTESLLLLFLMSLLKINVSTGISREDIEEYDEVIILGPIWGGLLISPLRSMLKICVKAEKPVHFAVSCETSEELKDSKYGYGQVLREAEQLGGKLVRTTGAFSTSLVQNNNGSWSPKLSEKTKITEENFIGIIRSRFNDFINRIQSKT